MMSNQKWVQNLIWAVIFLNLIVLSQVFIIPRTHFIASHFHQDREVLRESQGPFDMPNQYPQTYRMMRQVREMTGEDALLLLPPDNWEFGSPRSAVIQILYPRKIYFSGDQGFEGMLSSAASINEAHIIFNDQWGKELCAGRLIRRLEGQRFGICQLHKE